MKLNTIFNEDCLLTMKRIPDNFVDLILTSPPYDDLRYYHGAYFCFEKTANELFRILKMGGLLVWIVSDATNMGNESGSSFKQALYFKETGFNLFDTMIYAKHPRGAVGNNKTYWQSFEYMFVMSKGKPKTINLLRDRKNLESRDGDKGTKRLTDGRRIKLSRKGYGEYGRRTNIWCYHVGKGHSTKDEIAFEHPAIFPEELAKDHILSWSNMGDLVYDPFMGSGTTAKMAIITERKYLGSEISKEYYEIALKRLQQHNLQ